jgi:hypothetical protein
MFAKQTGTTVVHSPGRNGLWADGEFRTRNPRVARKWNEIRRSAGAHLPGNAARSCGGRAEFRTKRARGPVHNANRPVRPPHPRPLSHEGRWEKVARAGETPAPRSGNAQHQLARNFNLRATAQLRVARWRTDASRWQPCGWAEVALDAGANNDLQSCAQGPGSAPASPFTASRAATRERERGAGRCELAASHG